MRLGSWEDNNLPSTWSMHMSYSKKLKNWLGLGRSNRRALQRRGLAPTVESLESRLVMSAEYFVAPSGNDWAAGDLDHPFLTIRRALDAAEAGDTITLRNGVYEGGVNVDIDNLTIRSKPGEWAVIESPLTMQTDGHANSVIRYSFDVHGGKLENLEIAGGYYYGVMFWDWWDSDFQAGSTHIGASGITLDGVKIHDTGVDAVKITPGANDITIINSEIYNTGRRTTSSADGIDNNNGDRMIARNNYIHDIAGIGILTSGGTEGSLIENNFIKDTNGAGLVVGFYTELEWIEPNANPGYFAAIDTVARNNIVVDAGQAGIGVYGALNAQIYNNTLVNPADDAQAPIQIGGYDMWVSNTAPSYFHVTSSNVSIQNNLVVTDPSNLTRMVDIREGSLSGPLTLDYNLYFGTSTRGVLFIDRNLTGDGTPEQTLSQWQANYGYDQHSIIADPKLDATWHLSANSPAIDKAVAIAGLTRDFDGNLRLDPAKLDIGADEFGAGANLALPYAPIGAPSLEIAERGYHDYENNTILVKVVRLGSAADTVTVDYTTVDGTAKSGQDYVAVAGTLTFTAGETEKLVAVHLLSDSLAEGDEHFAFKLSNPTTNGSYPVRLGHQAVASMTIDDEQTPITLNYATKWVSNDGSDTTGDGSAASPWKSLQHAADSVGPGDYVIVKPGNYWGFQVTTDGKADARITFHAMPGVFIDAPNPENNLDGINLEGADFVTIEGFNVADMPRAGLRSVNNDGVILRGNTSDHNKMWGILTGWSENIIVENNVASRSQVEHGIYISNSADGAIVRNNTVWGNHDSGIQFNADRYLPGDGIHSNNLIEGNVIFENGTGGGAAINLDGVQDSIIRNNLVHDNHSTGIVLYVGFAADGSKNNIVTNNTVIMAEDARWALLMTDGSDGNIVTNNILLNKNPNRGSMTVESNSLPALSDHNIVQNAFQMDGANGSFAQWQAFAGGSDMHSIVIANADVLGELSDLFVDPAGGDFHLKLGSAAIDVGDAAHAPPVDIFQHARPSGAGVDIGAYEAGSFQSSVRFEWNDVIAYEFIGMAEVALTRTGDTEGSLTVEVVSSAGSAGANDYTPIVEQITFQPGEIRKTFRVFVNDDAEIEEAETVRLELRTVGDPTGLLDQGTLHIISDDAWKPGRFQFDSSSVTFNEADGTATITVHRVDGSSGPASVNYSTGLFTPPPKATWIKKHTDLLYPTDNDTPATVGDDYLPVQGTLNFADGETTKTITLSLVDDAWYEGDEAFMLTLSDPTDGAALGKQASLKVRIVSDDVKQPGTFVFAASSTSVTEGTPYVNVTILRDVGNVEASVRLYHTGAGNGSTTGSAWSGADYGSFPEIVTFAAGELSKTISIAITDDTSTEIDEVFSIQIYSPSNDANIGAVSKSFVTINDNESTFYFKAPDGGWSFNAVEGLGKMPITVVRQGSLATPASVRINTSDWGSATAGVDYVPIDVTLNFAPGEASKVVEVTLINDMLMEAKESFGVNMSNAVGASQGSWTWSAYITDDDVAANPGKFEFSAAKYSVSEAGGMLNVTVNRVGGSDGAVTVQYSTGDGAAGASYNQYAWGGAQYGSKSGTLSFASGETSKTFSIPINDNSSASLDKFFTVSLKNPVGGATLGAIAKAVVTIVEDDSAIEFGQSNYVVNESAGYIEIVLVRKGNVDGAASIDLNLSSGSATAGSDFIKPASPTVTFAAGETTKTVKIALIDDVFQEFDEWFSMSLTNAIGAKLGSSLWGNVKIAAND